jgi:hypothetical protein
MESRQGRAWLGTDRLAIRVVCRETRSSSGKNPAGATRSPLHCQRNGFVREEVPWKRAMLAIHK